MSVSRQQRFSRRQPCPICGGFDQVPRGKGERCFGFLSDDGNFANCTRDAGGLPLNQDSQTYAHRLAGPCRCGVQHGPDAAPPQRRIVGQYVYTDESGIPKFRVCRTEPKGFFQMRHEGGQWVNGLGNTKRVLFHLPEVLVASTVYVAEGEKDVETLSRMGFPATCNAGGAGKWRDEYSQCLAGKRVVILPDADDPGRRHALDVAASLLPVASAVKVAELPGGAKDISDWIATGGNKKALADLVKAAPILTPESLRELEARWFPAPAAQVTKPAGAGTGADRNSGPAVDPDEWPEPEPLQDELPPVEPFQEELLPPAFRASVMDTAERMQVPVDLPAAVAITSLAGAVNLRARVQPKANDTSWQVVPNLWGATIAPPGYLKSPVIETTTKPLRRIESDWRREYDEALAEHAQAAEQAELRHAAWKETFKAATKKQAVAPERPENPPTAPTLRRIIINDATFEALHQTMAENPAGVLVLRDELVGWWSQLDRAGREGERAFCLSAWNGDTSHTIDRIGRGSIRVEHCCMSMLGGIQPGRLRAYLSEALQDGPGNDGLLQRFQVLVWPDTNPDWKYIDRAPDGLSEDRAAQVYRRLVELDPETPMQLKFDPEAQELFEAWLTELEAKVRGNELHPALISHLGKYRSLMPSLAVLFELAEWTAGHSAGAAVSLEQTRRAAAWCDYLESHARRVYSAMTTPELRAARELAGKIRTRAIGAKGAFTPREVYLKGWTGLDTPEAVTAAAEVLDDAGWVRPAEKASADPLGRGRPSTRYQVNPKVYR